MLSATSSWRLSTGDRLRSFSSQLVCDVSLEFHCKLAKRGQGDTRKSQHGWNINQFKLALSTIVTHLQSILTRRLAHARRLAAKSTLFASHERSLTSKYNVSDNTHASANSSQRSYSLCPVRKFGSPFINSSSLIRPVASSFQD